MGKERVGMREGGDMWTMPLGVGEGGGEEEKCKMTSRFWLNQIATQDRYLQLNQLISIISQQEAKEKRSSVEA